MSEMRRRVYSREIENRIEMAQYRFAKSMPKMPHFYTLRTQWDSAEFDEAVQYIRDAGEPQRFYSKTYIYLTIGEYKYWTMGNPIHETKLINRASV